tara:strand:+ start:1107 stop:1493 length:387 start_codon:yes stop_codon:yes gene_type:complete
MPTFTLTLQFDYTIQDSVSVGDMAYAVVAVASSGFNVNQQDITKLGIITSINRGSNIITVETSLYAAQIPTPKPNPDRPQVLFVLFSKDNCHDFKSMLGYFGKFKFKNNSTEFAELFNITVDAFESSK